MNCMNFSYLCRSLFFTASFSPRKVDGLKTILSYWLSQNFQGLTVKLRECIHPFRCCIDRAPNWGWTILVPGPWGKTICQIGTSFLVLQTLLMLTWILIGFDCHWFILIVFFEVISGFIDFCWWLQMSYIKLLCFLCLVTVSCFFYFKISSLAADFFGPWAFPLAFEADRGIDPQQWERLVAKIFGSCFLYSSRRGVACCMIHFVCQMF